jgi:outer membrane receptor protein involved in Fe transport
LLVRFQEFIVSELKLHLIAAAIMAAYPAFALSAEPENPAPSPPSQTQPDGAPAGQATKPAASLSPVTVTAKRLDAARNGLSPDTGSTVYRIDESDIAALPLGASTPLNQVILRAPGVAQDSFGQLHIRGDHANLQYRINGVVIPEPITGFGQAIDTRFASELNLLTGALPAQYGYRTAGVIDIKTKGVDSEPGGEIGTVIGSDGHREVNGSISGVNGKLSYFLTGTLLQSDLGIENPTDSRDAIHDRTHQGKGFGYFSYLLDENSRVNLTVGTSNSRFQIPDRIGLQPSFVLDNTPPIASENLDARQRERNDFQVLSYQRSALGPLDFQVSVFHRRSTVDYTPDPVGDLTFNGIAGTIHRSNDVYGTQFDTSYRLNDRHTLRAGLFAQRESFVTNNAALVFPADADGNQTSGTPIAIQDDTSIKGSLYGVYLQDEWKASNKLTVNYGARFDRVNTVVNEQQLSSRIGLVYDLADRTRLHAGYARYFTPPPTEKIDTTTVAKFLGTTNALPSDANTAVKSERSNYYDIGVAHQLTPKLTVGLDGYYRQVRHLQDEGQFGNALVFSSFNYEQGKIKGLEFTASYRDGGFAAYGNVARSQALGKGIETGQFNFDPAELAFIANNWVHLDHDQVWTGSAGASYRQGPVTYSADLIFGSGLRSGFANSEHLPGYAQVNVAVARRFDLGQLGKFDTRLSVLNLLDRKYELRDGTGIGVGAPQFGPRRTLFVSLSRPFTF